MRQLFIFILLAAAISANAQDIIVKNDGESVKAFNLDIGADYVFYTLSKASDEAIHKLPKNEILVIRREDGTTVLMDQKAAPASAATEVGDASLPAIDIANYKGFLLAKGNVVYVESGATSYEQAGGKRLKELLQNDGFWHLAQREEQAHFIIKFRVSLEGRDHLVFYFLDKRERMKDKELRSIRNSRFGNGWTQIVTSESIDDNIVAANALYERIKKIQEKIVSTTNYQKGWFNLFYME